MSSGFSEVTNVTRAEVSKPTEGEHASLALEVDSKNIIIEETDIQASGGPPDEAGSGLKRRDINEPTVGVHDLCRWGVDTEVAASTPWTQHFLKKA